MQNLFRSSMVRNAGKLLTANVVAQAIGLLVYPVLTRMYVPEDFALLSLFVSIAGVLSLPATAEYQYAIVLPKTDEDASAITHVCLFLLAAMTLLLCLSLPFCELIGAAFNAPGLARFWWMMPLAVLGLGVWNILNYWYIRRCAFMRISGYQISQSVLSAAGKISLGMFAMCPGGMIVATVFAPLLSLVASGVLAWKKHLRVLLHPHVADMRSMAREYANFPKFNLPRSLVNSIGLALPVWLLTPRFGLAEVGQLSLAITAAFVPLSIIARACYQVLYQHVAVLVREQRSIRSVLWKFSMWMGGGVIAGLAIIYFVLPQLVTWLFGAEWLEAADVIKALYPYIVLTPVCGAICFLSDVFAKQRTAMWMEVAYVAATAAALLLGSRSGSFITAVSAFAWVRFAYLAIQLVWFAGLARTYNRTLS